MAAQVYDDGEVYVGVREESGFEVGIKAALEAATWVEPVIDRERFLEEAICQWVPAAVAEQWLAQVWVTDATGTGTSRGDR